VLSQSTVSELSDPVRQEDEALRPRDLSGDEGAYLVREAVDEPWRRWGSKPGVLCVGALGGEGRKGLLTLSTATSES
jgi:hypothetical protein